MLSIEELIRDQKKFSKLNLICAGFMLCYYLMFILFNGKSLICNFVLFFTMVICLVADYIFGKFEYMKSDFVIKIIKFVTLLAVSMTLVFSRAFFLNVFILGILYLSISIQAEFAFDLTESFSKIVVIFYDVIPVSIAFAVYMLIKSGSNLSVSTIIIAIIIYTILIYSMNEGFSELIKSFYSKINSLNGIASLSKEENENMKETQMKLVQTNEQLSLQKFKLQQANEIITKNSRETNIQFEIIKNLSKSLDIDSLLNKVITIVLDSLKLDLCSVSILSSEDSLIENKHIHYSKYTKESKVHTGNIQIIENKDFVEEYIYNGSVISIEEFANCKFDYLDDTQIKSILIYPLIFNEETSGIYIIGSCINNYFSENKPFLKNLANQLSLAITNALLYTKMKSMAIRDPLTGIYNRRYFNTIYNQMVKQSEYLVITNILFDIDKFKSINDTYGHVFGDEVISFCGATAKRYASQNNGFPVRYGGEEFVIIFPEKNDLQVLEICKQLQKDINSHKFTVDGIELFVNISIGIACYPENCDKKAQILDLSDQAMYYSKQNGRGRISIYNKYDE